MGTGIFLENILKLDGGNDCKTGPCTKTKQKKTFALYTPKG